MGYQSKQATAIVMDWMRLMKKRKDFIMNHPKKLEIARKILNARKDKKAITFSATIKMAESIGIGETIHSQKKSKENKEIIERFNDAATGVLNTSKSADQGVDCKGVNLEVILHTDSSKIRKVQRLGRSIRFEEGKIAEIFTLVIAGTQEVK
jgi:superfamily II DNA or RNA helicase